MDIRQTDGLHIACCGTCQHWRSGYPSVGEPDGRYCPVLQILLPAGSLRYWGCDAWDEERWDSVALELAEAIVQDQQHGYQG